MKSRTDDEMLELILGFAREDARVRAVLMNGSRVNPHAAPDIYRDFDVVFLVTDIQPFTDRHEVLPRFGEMLIVQQPDAMGPEDQRRTDCYAYLMQLTDGNRIDLTFHTPDALETLLKDSLTAVLLDKDGIVPELPPSSESSYIPSPPTLNEFNDCVNEFLFGLGSQIPKTLKRDELPLTKAFIEICLRRMLLKMYGWEFRERSIGKAGRYLKELLLAEDWRDYELTYCGVEHQQVWESLRAFYRLFTKSGNAVARACGFEFPVEEAKRVMKHVEHVRQLPPDAEAIYSD